MTAVTSTASPRFHTAAEWLHALGDVPLERIVMDPWPGTATEKDLLRFVERDKRLVELVDDTLVEKPVGWIEAQIALNLATALHIFVRARQLGTVAGADATLKMIGGNIRLPDISFISFGDMPGGRVPAQAVPRIPITLAIEVISEGNTKAEMRRKLAEYFDSGSKLVWFIHPKTKTIAIYEQASDAPARTLSETDQLDGGDVLPDFAVPVSEVFHLPNKV